jgi:hypothetical protein
MRYGLTMHVPGDRVAENLLLAGSGLVVHSEAQRTEHVGEGMPAGAPKVEGADRPPSGARPVVPDAPGVARNEITVAPESRTSQRELA